MTQMWQLEKELEKTIFEFGYLMFCTDITIATAQYLQFLVLGVILEYRSSDPKKSLWYVGTIPSKEEPPSVRQQRRWLNFTIAAYPNNYPN